MLTSDDVDGAMVSVKYIDLQREENVLEDGEQCSGLADKWTRHSILKYKYKYKYKSECDIRENFDTNECPNIFVSTKLHE